MMSCSWPLSLLPLLLITVLSQSVSGTNEADAIRLLDPCSTELGIAAATSDNLACFVDLVDQAPSSRCFNRSNICDGEIFCSNGTDEGMGFTSSQSRIVCGADNTSMFVCSSSESVELVQICDGNKDCNGGVDERFVLCKNKCRGSYYGGCPITRRCESSANSVTCGDCFPGYTTNPSSPTGDCLPVVNISFESPVYTATEGQHVEVCVNTTDPRIKSQQRLNVTVVITPGFRATESDYIVPPVQLRQLTLTKSRMRSCANISIVDDRVVEDTETFIVSLRSTGGEQVRLTDPMSTTVNILDNDVIEVGFTETCYISNGTTVLVCIEILSNVVSINTSTSPTVRLARDGTCPQSEASHFMFPTSADISTITSRRLCTNIRTGLDVPNTCVDFSLLQRCQFQIDRPPLITFREQTAAKVCLTRQNNSDGLFCSPESITANGTTFIWPRTVAGATSSFTCPNNRIFSVSRHCMTCMSTGVWQDFDRKGCGVLRSELGDIINSTRNLSQAGIAASIERLADAIATSPSSPVDQTMENLETIALILGNVADYVQTEPTSLVDDQIISASTRTVNGLLSWTPTAVTAEASSRLIQAFETISSAYAEQLPSNTTRSLSFQSIQLISQTSALEDLQEGRSISIGGGNFTIQNTLSLTNISSNGLLTNDMSIPAISLPSSIFQRINTTNQTALVFALYEESTLFPIGNASEIFGREQLNGTETRVGSKVISANIVEDDISFENLGESIHILLPVEINESFSVLAGTESCVSWDFDLQRWSRRGCRTSVGRNGTVLCSCDHLTNFAVLVDICLRQDGCQPINEIVNIILSFVSYIGIIVSIIALAMTIITMLAFKKLRRKDATMYHIQLCLSLFLMYTVALALVVTGSLDAAHILYGGCIFVSITVHYFTLVAVMWMGAEALVMLQKVVIVFVRLTVTQLVIVSIICWMVPVVPVLSTLIADQVLGSEPENDIIIRRTGTLSFCFLSHPGAFWGAFLGPILLIILFNLVVFACVIVILIRHVRGTSNKGKLKTKKVVRLVFSICGVMALFGLSWLFAILTFSVHGLRETFQILFTIFNSFQGLFIFLFFCVLNKESRESWQKLLCDPCKKSKRPTTLLTSSAKHPTTSTSGGGRGTEMGLVRPTNSAVEAYKPLALSLNTRAPSFNKVPSNASMSSPSASKQGRVLGMDDVPETSTFHAIPGKVTFIT